MGIIVTAVDEVRTTPVPMHRSDLLFALIPLVFAAFFVLLSAFDGRAGEADEHFLRAWLAEVLEPHLVP